MDNGWGAGMEQYQPWRGQQRLFWVYLWGFLSLADIQQHDPRGNKPAGHVFYARTLGMMYMGAGALVGDGVLCRLASI